MVLHVTAGVLFSLYLMLWLCETTEVILFGKIYLSLVIESTVQLLHTNFETACIMLISVFVSGHWTCDWIAFIVQWCTVTFEFTLY